MTTVGEHSAPSNFLQRWQETEPLRLWLYGTTVPLLGAAVVYGWLTTEQLAAWLPVAAALFIGSTVAGELARRQVNSPATLEYRLGAQDRTSYARGVQDALHRTPEQLSTQLRPQPELYGCRHVRGGRRCVLDVHGKKTEHSYE